MHLNFKTRGISPQGKPRVFFACHPKDFKACFLKASDEILERQNCSIWYPDDFKSIDRQSLEADLSLMQLILVPVTEKLLLEDSYVTTTVLPFAFKRHISVCPIVYEENLSLLLSKDERMKGAYSSLFGDLQFLDKFTTDSTAIPYGEKLTSYLDKVLIGDELAKKIRSAFDAYIFMSYRKKDRQYAQKLMRLIHSNELCRSIAIWYDEFLVPGEGFNKAIEDILKRSDLFALVVTPNLINENNYVMSTEYPLAKDAGKSILAAEMVATDRESLQDKFSGLPECIDASKDIELERALQSTIRKIALKGEGTAEHKFFIGLAYLGGIDVEVNFDIGLTNIEAAAEAGLPEAMEKLASIFRFGLGCEYNFERAVYWQSRLVERYREDIVHATTENCEKYLSALWDLGNMQEESNDFSSALKTYQRIENFYADYPQASDKGIDAQKIRVLYSIARMFSKTDSFESQSSALSYYGKIVTLLLEGASGKLKGGQLLEISNFFDGFALFLINLSKRFTGKLDIGEVARSARKLRRVIEKNNDIDFATTFTDSAFHYAAARNNERFLRESGIADAVKNMGGEVDFTYGNPVMEAEELLFMALSISEYLVRCELEKYRENYCKVFGHIADWWTSLGLVERATETYELKIAFLQKYSADYFGNLDVELAISRVQLAKARLAAGDIPAARPLLMAAISTLEEREGDSLRVREKLADACMQMALICDAPERIEYLTRGREILEELTAKFSTAELNKWLADCYCALAEIYTVPNFWDSVAFLEMHDKLIALCQKHYEEDKIGYSINLNRIYLLRTLLEDCRSVKSVEFVIKCIKIAINNCRTLLKEDSEFAYESWIMALNQIISFNRYAYSKLSGDILATWQNGLAYTIAENLNFIIDFAAEDAQKLLPHNFRVSFSDFALISGGVNTDFLSGYESLLCILFKLFIGEVVKRGMFDKSVDVGQMIEETYDELLEGLSQGYALQILKNERQELLSLIK